MEENETDLNSILKQTMAKCREELDDLEKKYNDKYIELQSLETKKEYLKNIISEVDQYFAVLKDCEENGED